MAEAVDPPQHHVREFPAFERADLVLPAEDFRPAPGAQAQRGAGGEGPFAVRAEAVDQQGVPQLGVQFPGLVGRGAVHAEPDGNAGGQQVGNARDPGREAGVGGGAVGDAGAGPGERVDVGVRHVDAVGHPDVGPEPADGVEVRRRAHAELPVAELLLLHRLRAVRVQPYAEPPGEGRGFAHQRGGDGERRAGRDGDPEHGAGRGVVVLPHGRLRGTQRLLGALDGEVRGQPAVRGPEVHRAAGRGEPQPDLAGGADLRAEQVPRAAREDVVVVHGRGDAAAGHHRQRGAGGGVDHGLLQAGPHRVERGQPVEEVRVLGESPGQPLVEVVVGVDEARGGQVPRGVDAAGHVRQPRRRRAGADGLDAVARDDEMPVGVLRLLRIDRRDGAVLDQDALRGCHEKASWAEGLVRSTGIRAWAPSRSTVASIRP